jgi:UDP-N-acetylmuramyl pentapeptide synthase
MNIKQQLALFVLAICVFCSLQLKKIAKPKIVGITGCAGKTSCQLAVLAP